MEPAGANTTLRQALRAAAVPISVLGPLYLLTQTSRNSIGVITNDIEAAFGLSATQMGMLSGVTYLAFGLAQIPGALLVARLGPARILPLSGLLLAAATAWFGLAAGFFGLLGARALMGIATAPLVPGTLAVFVAAAGERFFAGLSGLETWFGRVGVMLATLPLALLLHAIGWREGFAVLAGLAGLFVALALLLARAGRLDALNEKGAQLGLADIGRLARLPGMAATLLFQGALSSVAAVLLGLWGAPWLTDVYGYSHGARAALLLVMAGSWTLSALAWGAISRFSQGSQPPILAGAGVVLLCLLAAGLTRLPPASLIVWFALLGFATGSYPAVLSRAKQQMPSNAMVHGVALVSTGSMVTVFVTQLASGVLVDQFPGHPGQHAPEAYRAVMLFFAALMAVSLAAYAWSARPGRSAPAGA